MLFMSSELTTSSMIIKRHIIDKQRRNLFRCDVAFKNEIAAYLDLIPALKKFSNDNLPYPNCIFAGDLDGEIIAMEDLGKQGYRMTDRLKGLDLDHCSLVLKVRLSTIILFYLLSLKQIYYSLIQELAAFHAISLAMKVFDKKTFFEAERKMHEVVFTENAREFYSQVLDNTLNGAVSSLSSFSNANGELDKPIEILKRLKGEQLYSIMEEHVKNSSDTWKVICHGDLWINNFMFHYHNGKVKHVKFVDLQTIRYSNLTCDVLMLIYSSTEGELRHSHLDHLLGIYRESLISNLRDYLEKKHWKKLQQLEEEFTTENIKKEFAVRSLFGLGTSLWVMPAITFKSLANEMDNFVDSLIGTEVQENRDEVRQPKEFHLRVRDIVKEFYDRGFLDNIFIDI